MTQEELQKMIEERIKTLPFDREPASLYEPIKYVLSLGGKRIRPMLMLLSYSIFKDDPESILMQAAALETFHNFTLLHDDLLDRADMRHGQPTVHKKWDENTAILSGDSMLIYAFKMMMQSNSKNIGEVMKLMADTGLEIDEGQQFDTQFETRDDVSEEEYLSMIRLKTSVLLACATKTGALLAEASKEDCDTLYRFGETLGLAFQLQDDLLDVYGDPKVFGKQTGGDIMCNKKTYMLINALNRADSKQKAELQKWIDAENPDRNEKVAAVTALYDSIGIRTLCETKIEEYYNEALLCIEKINAPQERKEPLKAFAIKMMKRRK